MLLFFCVLFVQSHYPNGQPKPLANRYNQYLSFHGKQSR
jgi:hypothetical protein